MRAVCVGDIHLADRPPSVRTDSYADDILAKMQFAGQQAKNCKCDVIVYVGDIFHLKAPSRTSHGLVQRVIDTMQEPGIPVRIVPGNHDLMHDRLESIPTQPLGTLAKAPGIELLIDADEEFPWLFGIPYLQDWSDSLHLHMARWQDSDGQLMVAHAPIFPPRQEPLYDFISAADWARWMDAPGFVHYGHIHDQHGFYHVDECTFANNGALSRGSLHEESLNRKPKITLWDDTTGFSSIEVPCKPASEVFRLEEKQVADDQKVKLDEFLGAVGETKLVGLSLEEVLAKAKTMDLKPRTFQIIEESINHVQ